MPSSSSHDPLLPDAADPVEALFRREPPSAVLDRDAELVADRVMSTILAESAGQESYRLPAFASANRRSRSRWMLAAAVALAGVSLGVGLSAWGPTGAGHPEVGPMAVAGPAELLPDAAADPDAVVDAGTTLLVSGPSVPFDLRVTRPIVTVHVPGVGLGETVASDRTADVPGVTSPFGHDDEITRDARSLRPRRVVVAATDDAALPAATPTTK
jgi:hypothetical protein